MRDPLGCTRTMLRSPGHVLRATRFPQQCVLWGGSPVHTKPLSEVRFSGELRSNGVPWEEVPTDTCPVQPNQRMKLAACGRRLRRNAQWKPFILSAAPAGRSLCAIR